MIRVGKKNNKNSQQIKYNCNVKLRFSQEITLRLEVNLSAERLQQLKSRSYLVSRAVTKQMGNWTASFRRNK